MILRINNTLAHFVLIGLVLSLGATEGRAAAAAIDTLALVNGDPITTVELDRMVMAAHEKFRAGEQGSVTAESLLKKRTDDYLIIQDALAAGYDQDEKFQSMIEDKTREYAIGIYVRENVELPRVAPADSVRAYFDRYYWRIQLRRLSVRTAAEAMALRDRVAGGEDMDALARELSLDTKKLKGGLTNLMYWADVENRVRDAVRGLETGQISPVFAYNDAFAFARVEKLLPVNEKDFARFEKSIIPVVHGQLRQRVWDEFLAEQIERAGLSANVGALMAVVADSAQVLTGEFLIKQPELIFELGDGEGVTGTDLRRAISHEAMQKATEPFGHHLARARADLSHELVLGSLAKAAGYRDNPEVQALVQKDWEQDLITRYLSDHVSAKIKFKRADFETLYEENKEKMRGPDEVRLDVMILDDEGEATEAVARLHDGANFGFIFKQYNPEQELAPASAAFIAEPELSKPFRDALANMKVGDSSDVIKMPMGYMIFRLDGRRPGAVPALEEVEMDIRRTLFKREFDRLLAEHMEILRQGSEIIWYPERLAAYLAPAGEGK